MTRLKYPNEPELKHWKITDNVEEPQLNRKHARL